MPRENSSPTEHPASSLNSQPPQQAKLAQSVSFSQLGLTKALVTALPKALVSATDIQRLAIPAGLKGKDVLALAQTGSGKTLAFGLVILEKLLLQAKEKSVAQDKPSALVIVPTRELAQQVHHELNTVAMKLNLTSAIVCGGADLDKQIDALAQGPQLLIATPGRLLALVQEKAVSLSDIKHLVLDEADRLLEMGFWPDIQKIIAFIPANCQKLLFSATLPVPLRELADSLLYKPQRIEAKAASTQVAEIEERAYLVNKGSKAQALIALLKDALLIQAGNEQTGIKQPSLQTLVFINGKDDADSLVKKLNKAGLNAKALHGDKEQNIREQTLAEFKQGTVTVLVATDLLARGIHLSELPQVINFALPESGATYVHRIGRTGRAGAKGLAISLVCHGESQYLEAIEAFTQRPLRLDALAGFPVTDKPAPETAANARHTDKPKRAPRDKQANRRSMNKKSIKDFQSKK